MAVPPVQDRPLDDQLAIETSLVSRGSTRMLERRRVLQSTLAISFAALLGSTSMRALAQTPQPAIDTFMQLSTAITGHQSLDREVGTRLKEAIGHGVNAFDASLPRLAAALASGTLNSDQNALALRIMEGWYLGIVDNAVITYEGALMFDVVSDTLVIRTYCPGKPGFWAEKPIEKSV